MLKILVIFGAVLQLLASLSYIKGTIRGTTKPNRVTWFFWATAPIIGSIAAWTTGATWTVIPFFLSGFGPLMVFIASFWNQKSYWQLGVLDYLCGLFALLALVLWAITKEPVLAMIFSIICDIFAGIPTIKKMYQYPETENIHPQMASFFSAISGLLIVSSWHFTEYGFSVYLLLINAIQMLAFFKKRIVF